MTLREKYYLKIFMQCHVIMRSNETAAPCYEILNNLLNPYFAWFT